MISPSSFCNFAFSTDAFTEATFDDMEASLSAIIFRTS
jgi:hypothetical protein